MCKLLTKPETLALKFKTSQYVSVLSKMNISSKHPHNVFAWRDVSYNESSGSFPSWIDEQRLQLYIEVLLTWLPITSQLKRQTKVHLFELQYDEFLFPDGLQIPTLRLRERFDSYSGGGDIQCPNTYTPTDKVYSLIKSPYGLSCIKSLTQLSLTCVNVTGELVEHFLSNCPLLLRLCVSFSEHLVNLKIAGPSLCLKFLEISRCPGLTAVDIYAPNLASLTSLGFWRPTPVLVRHAPSLVDLTVAHPEGFLNALPASYFSQLESLTLIFDFVSVSIYSSFAVDLRI
ncbi:hypothetical protein RHGRI_018833 [Rhododendron griersonianum]|uniref:At1g61320/AtMIF1 LRR domain-containing protein n=1 Tax=Rhododendron griersonianum TaxID=479676 RepID=A0AAV6K2W8_9ERIC|nr:hypothetical protein RHGRI_018833 [Rhododendron griersonianum]